MRARVRARKWGPPSKGGLTVADNVVSLRRRTPIIWASEMGGPIPPVDFLCPGMALPAGRGAPHLIVGYGFSGKTVAMQSLALSLEMGEKVWGGFEPTALFDGCIRVLHVDYEQGEALTKRRYQRLAKAMGFRIEDATKSIGVLSYPEGLVLEDRCKVLWLEYIAPFDVVIIDSLRAASGGLDENDSNFRRGLDMLGRISEVHGARFIVVHHARKTVGDGVGMGLPELQSARGSSAITDACDSVYNFSGRKGEPVRVTQTKARTVGDCIDDFALEITDVAADGDPKGGLSVSLVGVEQIAESRAEGAAEKDAAVLLRAVSAKPGMSYTQLKEGCGLPGGRFSNALRALGGRVRIEEAAKTGGRGRPGKLYFPG